MVEWECLPRDEETGASIPCDGLCSVWAPDLLVLGMWWFLKRCVEIVFGIMQLNRNRIDTLALPMGWEHILSRFLSAFPHVGLIHLFISQLEGIST